MKNKKGFTLIELLAVIVVLVIISVIAINKITEVMRKNNENAIVVNTNAFVKKIEESASMSRINGTFEDGIYSVSDVFDMGLKMNGTVPKSGQLIISNGKVSAACFVYDKFISKYTSGKAKVEKGTECVSLDKYNFAYTGDVQVFTAPSDGIYKLEAWGAQGGESKFTYNSSVGTNYGGYGGYSTGEIRLNKGDKLYVYVGGKGAGVDYNQNTGSIVFDEYTGYNGGGYAAVYPENSSHSGGGGASHIAYKTGLLTSFKTDLESLIMVAGGGGGASTHQDHPNYSGTGGSGGGYIGGAGVPESNTCYHYGTGGTQSAVGGTTNCSSGGRSSRDEQVPPAPDFGKGSSYASNLTSNKYAYGGGGGGLYGGQSGYHAPGGGGSGYIGNTKLSNKLMYCYNCSQIDDENTKTISTTCFDDDAVENCSKKGNGEVTITLISV